MELVLIRGRNAKLDQTLLKYQGQKTTFSLADIDTNIVIFTLSRLVWQFSNKKAAQATAMSLKFLPFLANGYFIVLVSNREKEHFSLLLFLLLFERLIEKFNTRWRLSLKYNFCTNVLCTNGQMQCNNEAFDIGHNPALNFTLRGTKYRQHWLRTTQLNFIV